MGKSFKYTYLDLKDAGEVLVAGFRQASILDQAVIDQIAREFEQLELEAASNRKLLLDFQVVEYMSSAMLGKLIQLHKRCKADKIKLKFSGISKNPLDVFKITRLDKLFEIHADAPVYGRERDATIGARDPELGHRGLGAALGDHEGSCT